MAEAEQKGNLGLALQPPTREERDAELWAALTAPFPEDWVEKLPKPLARDGQKGRCEDARFSADGHYCGGWHSRAVHLDYVGHAGITMRLNDVLGPGGWDFHPYAEDSDHMPVISGKEFWAKLTILGVTKWDLAANFNGPQEALGDALRRCAMRFGIGTYLWSKSDHAFNLAKSQEPDPEPEAPAVAPHLARAWELVRGLSQEEKDNLLPWWDQQTREGHLPSRDTAGMAALTEPQVSWLEEVVGNLRDRLAADQQQTPQESQEPPPDPQ